MPDSGSAPNKTFIRSDGTRTGADVFAQEQAVAIDIEAANLDYEAQEMAVALTNRWMLDGGNQPSADLPLNSQKFTGVGVATARTHYAAASQVADSSLVFAGTSSGTDTIAASCTPDLGSYVAGQRIHFKAGGTNTGASTINIDALGAVAIKKGAAGTTALAAGDITTGGMYVVQHDGTNFVLLNPKFPDGFATTDTPQFTAINIGAAADTTLSRASAGDLQIEANIIYRASGTDVAVADGGTGASTAANAFTALKQAATTAATGVLQMADQAAQEAATTGRAVTSDVQHFHPSAAKCWAYVDGLGTPVLQTSFNITSITDAGTGLLDVAIATDFSTALWSSLDSPTTSAGAIFSGIVNATKTTGDVRLVTNNTSTAATDPTAWNFCGFGDL